MIDFHEHRDNGFKLALATFLKYHGLSVQDLLLDVAKRENAKSAVEAMLHTFIAMGDFGCKLRDVDQSR